MFTVNYKTARLSGLFVSIFILATLFAFSVTGARAEDNAVSNDISKKEIIKMPEFIGNNLGITSFLKSNLVYPEISKLKNIQGTVIVRVTIDKDGKAIETKIKQSVYPDIDQEALRVVTKLQDWRPGTINNIPYNMTVDIPIKFKLR